MSTLADQFLSGCSLVADAIATPVVADAWNRSSVLEGHTVGSLAAHLVEGCDIDLFLSLPVPDGSRIYEGAASYFAEAIELLTDDLVEVVHQRSSAIADRGPIELSVSMAEMSAANRIRLADVPADRLVHVFGGSLTLDNFLGTRIIEQVVHLDDLARSVGVEPWGNPAGVEELVVACGAEIGRRRFGGTAMVRSLFRDEGSAARTLPVI